MRPEDTALASGENEVAESVPAAAGVGRMADNERAVAVYFRRPLTDAELRFLHEAVTGRLPLVVETL